MAEQSSRVVFGKEGRLGWINPVSEPKESNPNGVLVKLDSGEEAWIPFDQLKLLPDGNYYLLADTGIEQWKTGSQEHRSVQSERDVVIPVIEETIEIGKKTHHEKVQVSKQVHEEEVEIDEPGFIEEIEIERIAKDEVLDGPVSTYTEGDTMVIPVVEERIVITKQLVLVEEVRVRKLRREIREPHRVKVRREDVVIDRNDQ